MSIKILNINYSIFFIFDFVKAGSRCVSTVETGSRLTCLAVVNPEGFLKQLKQMTEEENTAGTLVAWKAKAVDLLQCTKDVYLL